MKSLEESIERNKTDIGFIIRAVYQLLPSISNFKLIPSILNDTTVGYRFEIEDDTYRYSISFQILIIDEKKVSFDILNLTTNRALFHKVLEVWKFKQQEMIYKHFSLANLKQTIKNSRKGEII